MDIIIKIDDNQINELVKDGFEALTIEDKKQILIKGITQLFESEKGQSMLLECLFTKSSYYNSSYELNSTGQKILSSCISDRDFSDLKEILLDKLKSNGKDILVESLMRIIMKGFANDLDIRSSIENTTQIAMNGMLNAHIGEFHCNN